MLKLCCIFATLCRSKRTALSVMLFQVRRGVRRKVRLWVRRQVMPIFFLFFYSGMLTPCLAGDLPPY